jgi:hypothetical protein
MLMNIQSIISIPNESTMPMSNKKPLGVNERGLWKGKKGKKVRANKEFM